ncbi:hypothetical protein [Nocardia brasiliensis]|uniref:hypothetical protein n=1 Tax=Nocardia brasiliensis TaxID=37326 RepID=UPI0024540EE9|nr:hypothetical protein [Nocardia brasiliensis]
MADLNWWMGLDTDRLIGMTGWVGETPEGEVAFLLLYPMQTGLDTEMRQLGSTLGLAVAAQGAPPESSGVASIALADGWVRLHLGEWSTELPANPDFTAAARIGWGVLIVGERSWSGNHAELDRYLSADGYRAVHHGRVPIR